MRVELKEFPSLVELHFSSGPTSIAGLMKDIAAVEARLHPEIQTWSIHNDMRVDQDAELRRAAVTRSENRIEPDGQNLIAVLHTLYTSDACFEEFIDNSMTTAFPTIMKS